MHEFETTSTNRRSPVWFLVAALVAYGVSMLLPAWRDGSGVLTSGYEAAYYSFALGFSMANAIFDAGATVSAGASGQNDGAAILVGFQANIAMIVGLIFSFFKGRIPRWIATLQFAIAFLMAILLSVLPATIVFNSPFYEQFHVGYYMWTFSFALACWGSWLRLRGLIWPNETDDGS